MLTRSLSCGGRRCRWSQQRVAHFASGGGSAKEEGSEEQASAPAPSYFAKWRGAGDPAAPAPPLSASLYAGALSFASIGVLSLAHHGSELMGLTSCDFPVLLASFGATASLVFAAPDAPFSQPRNVIGGHVVSALVGTTAYQLCGTVLPEVACPLAVAGAIIAMQQTRCLHPPSAATAMLAVIGSDAIHQLGFAFPGVAAMGSALLVGTGVIAHNMRSDRQYPRYWW